jgi:predicted RNase H-like nuclease (RuvC/YqgF family)
MLLRISLILAILAGIGTIVVTQIKTREHIKGIIAEREQHKSEEDKERKGRKKAETELTATKDALSATKSTLAKTEEELNGTKQRLAAAEESISKLKGELASAIESRKKAEADLAKWASLGYTPEQVVELGKKVKVQSDAIAALEDEKAILARNAKELQNKIDLLLGGEEFVVKLPANTKGNVMAVDPKWNFVVLDLGKNKEMLEGGILMVHRNSQLVGKVRIREVMQDRCVATVMPGWSLGEIEEGDQVIY